VVIIKRSNCIDTAFGIVFSVSDRPVCRLRRNVIVHQVVHLPRVKTDMIFNYPQLHLMTKEVFFRKVLWCILFSVTMEMVENHISDAVAREVRVHLLARGSRQTHFPKFCVSLYFGNQDYGKKIQVLINSRRCLFSDIGRVLKHDPVPCIQLACKKKQHFLLF